MSDDIRRALGDAMVDRDAIIERVKEIERDLESYSGNLKDAAERIKDLIGRSGSSGMGFGWRNRPGYPEDRDYSSIDYRLLMNGQKIVDLTDELQSKRAELKVLDERIKTLKQSQK